jgi:hypothetical protein
MGEIVEHKDILGKTISIGDVVAMSTYNNLTIAVVDKINPKMIRVKRPNTTWTQNKYPSDLIKIDNADAMEYLLRNT